MRTRARHKLQTGLLLLISLGVFACGQKKEITEEKPRQNFKYRFVFMEKAAFLEARGILEKARNGEPDSLLTDLAQMLNQLDSKVNLDDPFIKYHSSFDNGTDWFLNSDSLTRVGAKTQLTQSIADLKNGKKEIAPSVDSYYLFWKASTPFNQSFWHHAPANDLGLSIPYWDYLYEVYDDYRSIIIGSIEDQHDYFSDIYGEMPITEITAKHAKALLAEIIGQEEVLNKYEMGRELLAPFQTPDPAMFLEMLDKTARGEWLSWHFDWD